jgi:magnesium-transporting ATPase (P-type)
LNATGDEALARSVTFATIGVCTLLYVFSIKTLKEPFWKESVFGNKWLVLAVGGGFVLQLLPFTSPLVMDFLEIKPIGYWWLAVILCAFILFILIEIFKEVLHKVERFKKRRR